MVYGLFSGMHGEEKELYAKQKLGVCCFVKQLATLYGLCCLTVAACMNFTWTKKKKKKKKKKKNFPLTVQA